jgi:TonB family protein
MRLMLSAMTSRLVPLAASGVLHVSVAGAMLTTSAGHARPAAEQVITVDLDETPAPPVVPAPQTEPEQEPEAHAHPHPSHTHPYPVPPSHDMHPHDPDLVHTGEPAHEHDVEPAAPAAVATAEAPAPRFTISLGAAKVGATVVASGADGAGHGGHSEGGAENELVPESRVAVPAKLVAAFQPAYPPAARAAEVEAEVPLEIVVDASGRVIDANVRTRAGYGFDEAALSAIRHYRFSPAERDGHRVRVRMRWTVQFRLR